MQWKLMHWHEIIQHVNWEEKHSGDDARTKKTEQRAHPDVNSDSV